MKSILITGGSGLIGRALIKKLQERNYRISILSRDPKLQIRGVDVYQWDVPTGQIDKNSVAEADIIVHLAGAGIGEKRWTKRRKQEIIDSRVASAELLYRTFSESRNKLMAFISSSAIGWYGGFTTKTIFNEDMPAAADFMGKTCRLWEAAADLFHKADVRTVKIRTGVVLSTDSGALPKMALPVKVGLGSALGSGSQLVPWIHIDDIVGIYLKAIEDETIRGAFNGVAPAVDSMNDFMHTLSRTLDKPYFMPALPAFVLKTVMGEMAVLVTEGSRISEQKIQDAGYSFIFPQLDVALKDLF